MADAAGRPPSDPTAPAAGPAALDALRALPGAAPLLERLRPEDPAWIVGGAVRDLLLGRTPGDLDVLVVGPTAPDVAARLGVVVATHDRFGTHEVEAAPGVRYDVVRARSEAYPHPGALPEVAFVDDVAADLPRRDVAVNAVALRLADGALAAVPGALDDLAAGRLRVLHDRSFDDDPTRVWRLARYGARLGFAPDARTLRLAAAADPRTVSGARHGRELRLALSEPDPAAVLRRLIEWSPRFLPPGFDPEPARLDAARAVLPADGRADLVRLAASVGGVSLPDLLPWLGGLGLTAREEEIVGAGSRPSTREPLRHASRPSEIRRAARNVPVEVVALDGGENARRWIEDLRHVRLEIDGRDLAAAGVPQGPEVGRRLERALDAKLDGELPDAPSAREAELRAALAGPAD